VELDAVDAVVEELRDIPVPELLTFPTELISKLSGGIVRCLNDGAKPFSIKSGNPQEITFVEPVYVATVDIEFSRPFVGAELELSVSDAIHSRVVRRKLQHETLSEKASFAVGCVTSSLTLYLPPGMFELFSRRTFEIKKITVKGFTSQDFETLNNSLGRIVGLQRQALDEISREKKQLLNQQAEVAAREKEVDELEDQKNSELESIQAEISACQKSIEESTNALAKIREDIGKAETKKQVLTDQISNGETTIRNIEGEITRGKQNLTELALETSEKQNRLRELSNNVNLFSEEFSSFSDHGAKQTKVFIGLSIVPLIIIALLTSQLLLGAVDLSVKYVKQPNLDLVTIFVTRIPYLTVCGSILAVCYSAFHFLFNRISSIYAERLDFAKIGIIAKDVASASAERLPYSDHELYEARTYLKIEMLKSYLSGNIGTFTYQKRKERPRIESEQPVDEKQENSPHNADREQEPEKEES